MQKNSLHLTDRQIFHQPSQETNIKLSSKSAGQLSVHVYFQFKNQIRVSKLHSGILSLIFKNIQHLLQIFSLNTLYQSLKTKRKSNEPFLKQLLTGVDIICSVQTLKSVTMQKQMTHRQYPERMFKELGTLFLSFSVF